MGVSVRVAPVSYLLRETTRCSIARLMRSTVSGKQPSIDRMFESFQRDLVHFRTFCSFSVVVSTADSDSAIESSTLSMSLLF